MDAPYRVLLVSEPADEADARAFLARLAAFAPAAALDHFEPSFSFASVPAWLVTEARGRVAAAAAVVCLLGARSEASAWTTWAINAGLDSGKRVACVRLHGDTVRDRPPPIVGTRRVTVLDADARSLLSYLVEGKFPLERPRLPEPEIEAPLLTRFAQRGT
jgi:hypothetical protein